jgi:Integrase core domain
VGRPTHSWRTAQARVRDRRVDGLRIHDSAPRAAIADLANIPAQPCGSHRGHRSLRGSNSDVRVSICVPRIGTWSTTATLVRGDPAPDRGVAGAADRGGIPLGPGATYLVRDNDRAYGQVLTNRVRAMGIRDRPISPRSPWQNAYVERLIGTLRRECLDHVLIYGERHLRRILTLYSLYYNETRTHLGLGKDAPLRRPVQRSGTIVTIPILSGLHHRYARI